MANQSTNADRGNANQVDVVVVGGGPVGLTLAHALGARDVRTLVVERRLHPPERSMAIGITPPSLEIFRSLGLVEEFLQRGVPIRRANVYENRVYLGTLDFDVVPSEFRFILSLPQSVTVQLLASTLSRRRTVQWRRGTECVGIQTVPGGVRVLLREDDQAREIHARWVVGCDGHRSLVRNAAEIKARHRSYPVCFMMSDFEDRTGWGDEARVFFGEAGAVESFPMPGGLRRWIVQLPRATSGATDHDLVELVQERTGHLLTGPPHASVTVFQPKRMEAERYSRDPVVLCGDAAHVMSPIGGQGMNAGFADAVVLARVLEARLRRGGVEDLTAYERERRRAFRLSARRAARGMWIGTRLGRWRSRARRWLIERVFFHPWCKPRLAAWFAMLPDFTVRAGDLEEMDRSDCCPKQLLRTVDQFASINRCFSRYRTLLNRWVFAEMRADPSREYHLVDLGAGGCDIAVWALGQARRLGVRLRVTALELDARIAAHAQRKHAEVEGLSVRCMDAEAMEELGRIDYVLANHFLHHLDEEKVARLLRLIGRIVERQAILSDLQRNRFSYLGYGIFATLFYRRSFAVRDGLLSIRKGFVPADFFALIRRADLTGRAWVNQLFPGRLVMRIAGRARLSHATLDLRPSKLPRSVELRVPTCPEHGRRSVE